MQRALLALASAAALACSASPGGRPDFGADVLADDVVTLTGAPALELLALDPAPPDAAQRVDPTRFHGYAILGRATVTDAPTRERLLDLLARSCRENDGMVAACFDPRHGVRAIHGGHTVDLVICFECLSLKVYRDGAWVHDGDLADRHEPAVSALYEAQGLRIDGR